MSAYPPDNTPEQWAERLGNLKRDGKQWEGPCPICGDGGKGDKSNRLHVQPGDKVATVAGCRVCKAPFADLLYATFHELDPANVDRTTRERRTNSEQQPTAPKAKPQTAPKEIGPGAKWQYFNADGSQFATIKRTDYDDGSKTVAPTAKGLPRPFPLYQLPDLIEQAALPVLIVEGEKASDAAQRTVPGYAATTSMGGSNRASQTDWTPLANRDVVLWPDNDDAGSKYAWKVYELALDAGAREVRVVRLPEGLPKGWDLADAVPDDIDLDVEAIMETRADAPGLSGLLTMDQFMAIADDTVWLVEGLLPGDGLAMISAAPKVGKSTFTRCLAKAVADPGCSEFLGHAVTAGPVLYVNLEERLSTIQGHFRQLGGDQRAIRTFYRKKQQPGQPPDLPPDFEGRVDKLRQWVALIRPAPALIIIDTLGRFIPMKPEQLNDYAAMMAYMEPFLDIARTFSACVLFVHHDRKSGGDNGAGAMGSTAITATMDTTITVSRDGNNVRSCKVTGRDGVETDSPVILSHADGWIDAEGTRAELADKRLHERVLDVLTTAGGNRLTTTEINNELKADGGGVKAASLSAALRELHNAHDIERDIKPGQGGGKHYYYVKD